jgi:transcriptional regulator with XRE-family HTH domain
MHMSKETTKKEFSLRFQEACRDISVTNRDELAAKFGVTQGMISGYWNGNKMPSTENGAEMAEILNVTMDWLFCGRPPKRPGEDILNGLTSEQKVTIKEVVSALKKSPIDHTEAG